MTNQPLPLDELDVIGYADVLPEGKGPAVVPPVFRHRTQPDRCFVPPFRVVGNWLIEPQGVSFPELADLEDDEGLTLPKEFRQPARPDHQLWVDETGAVRYEPLTEAKRNQQRIYHEHLRAAVAALREGRLDESRRLAGIALAANDRALEADALIAAYHVLRGEASQAAFMRKSAEQGGLNGDTFTEKVKTYLESIPPETWEKPGLDVERVVETGKQLGIEVWIPFRLTEEEFRRFEPILHHYSRAGGEHVRTISCPGVEAILMAERETLRTICEREEKWIKLKQQRGILEAVAKTMLYESPQVAAFCRREPQQILGLGGLLRTQIRPNIVLVSSPF